MFPGPTRDKLYGILKIPAQFTCVSELFIQMFVVTLDHLTQGDWKLGAAHT